MKNQSNLAALVSIATLATGPFVIAENAEPVTPEIVACEFTPEIADCPEILPEIPEICVLPPPTEEPISVDDHIEPVVDPTVDPVVEIPSDTDLTEGSDGKSDENEAVDSNDPNADNEATKTVEDDSFVTYSENEVPIEWLQRGGNNEDPHVMYYSMAPNPVDGNPAPLLEKDQTSNALARELGQDDKAAAINPKANAATPKLLSEKNEPTVLIKKGRVFLR